MADCEAVAHQLEELAAQVRSRGIVDFYRTRYTEPTVVGDRTLHGDASPGRKYIRLTVVFEAELAPAR